MDNVLIVRALALYVPISIAASLAARQRPHRALAAGILLASAWNAVALLGLNVLAIRLEWWTFHAKGGLFLGMPLDLYLGWIVLWGAIPLLVLPALRIGYVAAVFALLDLVTMPRLGSVLQLGPHWLAGEAVGIGICLFPSLLLGRWTRDATCLYARSFLQVIAFSGLTLGILPASILALTGKDWSHLSSHPIWANSLWVQLLALPAVLGLSAVQEFALRGLGTPLPYDPPQKLVTSGPYAYLANPMQSSAVLMMLVWGGILGSAWVALAGLMAHVYSAGLAAWDESEDVHARFGKSWEIYRQNVRSWIPRWRPWHLSMSGGQVTAAHLYVSETCGPCSEVKHWFEMQGAQGMLVVAAETRPELDLRRISYDPGDGGPMEQGVKAISRGLEHIHLGWAFVAWWMRLPILSWFLQLLADAAGAGPRQLVLRPGTVIDARENKGTAREPHRRSLRI